jgi:hypothetical protein
MNPGEHWFWWLLVHAAVVWYSTVTVYVAIKGFADVKGMLKRLASQQDPQEGEATEAGAK